MKWTEFRDQLDRAEGFDQEKFLAEVRLHAGEPLTDISNADLIDLWRAITAIKPVNLHYREAPLYSRLIREVLAEKYPQYSHRWGAIIGHTALEVNKPQG